MIRFENRFFLEFLSFIFNRENETNTPDHSGATGTMYICVIYGTPRMMLLQQLYQD